MEHTIAGPRIFLISPEGVLIAVSPPTIPVQSDSIVTQTKGKLSKCHAKAGGSSSVETVLPSAVIVVIWPPTEMLMLAIS